MQLNHGQKIITTEIVSLTCYYLLIGPVYKTPKITRLTERLTYVTV